jgi:hypothetical protein
MIQKTGGTGIAIENNCAIEFIDGRFYRVITSRSYARAYKVYKTGGEVIAEQIPQQRQLRSVSEIFKRTKTLAAEKRR